MVNDKDDVIASCYHQLAGTVHHNIVDYHNISNHINDYVHCDTKRIL